eukprot:6465987-Amphidinium_carterae.1
MHVKVPNFPGGAPEASEAFVQQDHALGQTTSLHWRGVGHLWDEGCISLDILSLFVPLRNSDKIWMTHTHAGLKATDGEIEVGIEVMQARHQPAMQV